MRRTGSARRGRSSPGARHPPAPSPQRPAELGRAQVQPGGKRGGRAISPLAQIEAELEQRIRAREALAERLASPAGEDVAALGEGYVALDRAIVELERRWELLAEEATA